MTGEPYCPHCGTIIRWYDDEDDEDDDYRDEIDASEFLDCEILIDLYNRGADLIKLVRMQEKVKEFADDFSCRLVDAQIFGEFGQNILLNFLKEEKYWSVILRATYDMEDPFRGLDFKDDLFEGNFEKLYADEKFRQLIKKEEKERNIKAERCRLFYIEPYSFIVSVIFNNCEAELDLDVMSLKSWIYY